MANGLRFRHRSSLPTEFDEEEEARKLRRDPNRGKVEGIRELRNRPDPETDRFLRRAAKRAGFKDGGSFGPGPGLDSEDEGIVLHDKPVGSLSREERLAQQFGGTDFTSRQAVNQPPTRTPGRDSNQAPKRTLTDKFTRQPTQGELVAAGKAPPPEVETEEEEEAPNPNIPRRGLRRGEEEEEPAFIANARAAGLSEQDIQDLQNPAAEFQGPQGLTRRVSSSRDPERFTQTRAFEDGGVAQVSFDRSLLGDRPNVGRPGERLEGFGGGRGGTVRSIPAESFVNPAFTGINSGENIAAAVREDFRRDLRDRQAAERQEQQLQEDANLRLSGNMSLVELADAASRRRNARETLANRRSAQSEQALAQQQFAQDVTLEQIEQRGEDRRAGLEARRELTQDQREARRENVETNREALANLFPRFDGEENQPDERFADSTLSFIEASNADPGALNRAEAQKFGQFNKLRENLIQQTQRGVSPENLSELRAAIGNIDKEVLNEIGGLMQSVPAAVLTLGASAAAGWILSQIDETDVRIRNLRGQQEEQINLSDLAKTPEQRRALFEIIADHVDSGRETAFGSIL